MKKFKKLILSLGVISIVSILLAFSASATDSSSTVITGEQDSITYKIYPEIGVMILSGEGKIPDHMFDRLKLACTICYPESDFESEDAMDDGIEYTDLELTLLKVKTVIIEEGITEIGHRAFDFRSKGFGSLNLTTVILPDSLKKIGAQAFVSTLENINFPSNLEEIGKEAFAHTGLKNNITIPESVTKIDERAFSFCNNLKSITFTNAVCGINSCNSLEKIIYPIDYEEVPEVISCKNLKQVIIPVTSSANTIKVTKVVHIDDNFCNCPNLESITLSDKAFEKYDKENIHYAVISEKLPSKLDKVTNFKCTDKGEYTFSWSPVKNAGSYQLYWYKNNKKWVKIYEGNKTSFTQEFLNPKYGENKFKVRACAYDGKESIKGSFTTVKTYRVGDTDITNTTIGKNKVTLTWEMKLTSITNITGYQVYYRASDASSFKKFGNINGTKCTINNLTSGKTYQFKVRAYYKLDGKIYYGNFSYVKTVKIK